jgi:hypothetical protein
MEIYDKQNPKKKKRKAYLGGMTPRRSLLHLEFDLLALSRAVPVLSSGWLALKG